jgi:hypothetical protein
MGNKNSPAMECTLPHEILNAGLNFVTGEWGDVRQSLAKRYPELTAAQLDECSAVCHAAKKFGYEQIGKLELPNLDTVYEDGFENFRRLVTARHRWVDEANLDRLFSQGIMAMLR